MKLDVQVKGKTVAQLYRERDDYILQYSAETPPEDFVSLTMPVRPAPWVWPRDLHPFFRQNLPEGYLLSVIREEFGRYLDGTDLSLLAVIGGMSIGRVTETRKGVQPASELVPVDVADLLHGDNSTEHFASLVHTYARAAISGVVPKFIAPESPELGDSSLGKSTIRTSRHIIKGSDDRTPFLGFNEYYSMRVLERLDVARVAKTRMSDDGRVLVVERFDVDENGLAVAGVEDACGLLGLPPHEKYAPSTEDVLRATQAYLPAAGKRAQLEQFGWQLLTNYVIRNADCHAKNIALFYATATDVAYTPAYDIVTTQAYPVFAKNPPGLTIGGRKTWAPGKSIETLFKARLGIAPKKYHEMVEQLCESVVSVGQEVAQAAKNDTQWRWIAKQMLHAWNDGMETLRSSKPATQLRQLTHIIEMTGFSDTDKPEHARQVFGRSDLMAVPTKKRKSP
jgi:serine/threonine-protein kinase HipA